MKKFLTMGALALTLAAVSNHQASAWTNLRFSAGLNLGYQAGGNNFGWGLFRNGQPPETCCPAPAPAPYSAPSVQPSYPPQTYAQPSFDQGNGPSAGVPAQTQAYRTWPTQTVNYQYPYSYSTSHSYYYGYRPYGYNYGYYR